MRKINEAQITSTSAMFYKQGTWSHLQKAYIEPIAEIVKTIIGAGYSDTEVYVLNGCVNTGSGSTYTISAGSVFYNGEVYLVDATSFTVSTGTAVATIVTTQNTTDYNADPCLFSDGVYKNVHDINKVVIAEAATGTGISDYANFSFHPYEGNYEDVSSTVTINGSFTGTDLRVLKYSDGTVQVTFSASFSGTISSGTNILSGLPLGNSLYTPVIGRYDSGSQEINLVHVGLADVLQTTAAISTHTSIYVNYFYKTEL